MCREAHSEYYVTLPNMPVAQHAHPADRFARDRWHFDAFWCGALAAADAQSVGLRSFSLTHYGIFRSFTIVARGVVKSLHNVASSIPSASLPPYRLS